MQFIFKIHNIDSKMSNYFLLNFEIFSSLVKLITKKSIYLFLTKLCFIVFAHYFIKNAIPHLMYLFKLSTNYFKNGLLFNK